MYKTKEELKQEYQKAMNDQKRLEQSQLGCGTWTPLQLSVIHKEERQNKLIELARKLLGKKVSKKLSVYELYDIGNRLNQLTINAHDAGAKYVKDAIKYELAENI